MNEMLYLAHRIPYPPNKGDKIRSYHLLKHLKQTYRVHVGAFVDDPEDWQHAQTLAELAGGEIQLLPLHPRWATLRSARGLLTGEPLTLPYYRDPRMRAWIKRLLARRPVHCALVYSSSMAQYLMRYRQIRRVIDFVDIDSDKWRQYAEKKTWPMSWVYRREARSLFEYEKKVTEVFDASVFVSEAEAAHFRKLAPACADKIIGFSNGVDTDYFAPDQAGSSPYPDQERAIVFTGAMDYWANVDAVTWFAREVFPAVLRAQPKARFYIVGARPTPAVQAMAKLEGVRVTGTVPDTRPYIAHAAVAVAPLRIARGIQNKVLEAMAMARPVVVTPAALEGIDAEAGREVLVADWPDAFAEQVLTVLEGKQGSLGAAARKRVVRDYSWAVFLQGIDRILDTQHLSGPPGQASRNRVVPV